MNTAIVTVKLSRHPLRPAIKTCFYVIQKTLLLGGTKTDREQRDISTSIKVHKSMRVWEKWGDRYL